jgi:hypothetical protein
VTTSETFVSRWARLKRNADIQRRIEPAGDPLLLPAADPSPCVAEATIAQPRIDAVDDPFDPSSLPSIETITGNTDIRGFLQSRVPAELTRAALRQAWASDPAIRDFIGIAENQWDFNDPTAMPGFGPLQESDHLPALLARALGSRDSLAGVIPEMPVSVEQSLPADREVVALDQTAPQAFAGSPPVDNIGSSVDTALRQEEAGRDDGAEGIESPRQHRSHGSALPR